MRLIVLIHCFSIIYNFTLAQNIDSLASATILSELTFIGKKSSADLHQLPEVVSTNIYAGKKSSLLVMDNVQGNVVTNTMRQVVGKVPGLFIWENESSGIQINIAARGLSPNRSWEFNVRQNGYDIAADPFGYPEAYYNPQLQSVQRIEVVRGHGALQYGAQLGGMINYILKDGSDFTKKFQVETFQTIGSNGLFNAYQAIGGNTGKFHYYTFFDFRQAEGWRQNNKYNSLTGSGSLTWNASPSVQFTAEFTNWTSDSQQPGGLTDLQFQQNPKQSVRSRNWFGLSWQTAAFTVNWKINPTNRLNFKIFKVNGDRESVGFFPSGGIVQQDILDPLTGAYSPRTIDIDLYRNTGMEIRSIHQFTIAGLPHTLSTGLRAFGGSTLRLRGGIGSKQNDANFRRMPGTPWNAEIDFTSFNSALFAEDLINVTDRLMIIPGFRLEYLSTTADGSLGLQTNNPVALTPQQRQNTFMLAGLGMEYLLTESTRIYFNSTQSYRPVQFADLTTPPTTDIIDPELQNSSGLNTDIGIRGQKGKKLLFDFSLFNLNYRNRIGMIKQQRSDGSVYNFRTNIGSSRAMGIEAFTEIRLYESSSEKRKRELRTFLSGSLMDARYQNLQVINLVGNELVEKNYRNKKVEYAPDQIIRAGVTAVIGKLTTTLQVSHTSEVFTDANNTRQPTANAQNGLIPSYTITDLCFNYRMPKGISIRGGLNNLFDTHYFTRRSSGYPGPGLLPADGRTFFLTFGWNMTGR